MTHVGQTWSQLYQDASRNQVMTDSPGLGTPPKAARNRLVHALSGIIFKTLPAAVSDTEKMRFIAAIQIIRNGGKDTISNLMIP